MGADEKHKPPPPKPAYPACKRLKPWCARLTSRLGPVAQDDKTPIRLDNSSHMECKLGFSR